MAGRQEQAPGQNEQDSNLIDTIFQKPISRRNAMKLGGVVVGVALADRVAVPIIDQQHDEWLAGMNNAEFVDHFKEELGKVRFGTSFAPEMFGISLADPGYNDGRMEMAKDALRFAVEDAGLRSVRFGVRWNNVLDGNGNIDFSLYQEFFEYLLGRGIRVCPNFGYKVLRWPEEHVPLNIAQSDVFPGKGKTIQPNDEFGEKVLSYNRRMAAFLRKEFGDSSFPTVQIENEPMQRFGQYENILSPEFVEQDVLIAREFFPNSKVLLNAGGARNVERMARFIESKIRGNSDLAGVLKLGVDLHFESPKMPWIIRKLGIDTLTADEILYGRVYDRVRSRSKKVGYEISAAEVQIENYGSIQRPLRSPQAMKKAIARTITDVLRTGEDDSVSDLRFWGLEKQYLLLVSDLVDHDAQQRVALLRSLSEVAA